MTILTTLPTESYVAAAFAELLADVSQQLAAARTARPIDKEEIKFWQRQLNALNKAQSYWLQGVRPQMAPEAYLLASASRNGATVHRLTKEGAIVVCSCEAGQNQILCWHHMLVNIIEHAAELAAPKEEISGGGSGETPEAAAQQLLKERLEATAQIISAMRAAQQRPQITRPDFSGVHIGQRLAAARRVYLEAA